MHGPPAPPPDSIGDLVDVLAQLARDSADQAEAIARLGLMELQLSVASLTKMAGLAIALSFGLFITWGLALATIVYAGIWSGLSPPLALLLCMLLNAGITLWLFSVLRNTKKDVGFSRLRNFLESAKSKRAEDESAGR